MGSLELEGRVALVTGGSRGIGRAIAGALARAGASVVLTARTAEAAAATAQGLAEATEGRIEGRPWEARNEPAAPALTAAVLERFGRLDILVNNAGLTRDNLLLRMKDEEWKTVIETDLEGVFYLTRAALRPMIKQRGGRIINVSSVAGIVGNPGQTNYSAAKAGLIGFTKALAKEVGSRGITVNAVAPGYIETDMTEGLNPEVKARLKAAIPLERFGSPEDVAGAVLFLASPAAAYITGAVLQIDGGLAM